MDAPYKPQACAFKRILQPTTTNDTDMNLYTLFKKSSTLAAITLAMVSGALAACSGSGNDKTETEALRDTIVSLRQRGKDMRNQSRFDEALRLHSEGLNLAKAIGDTSEWIQALNNIGTDYRRMGIYDVAQEYHYNAYRMCEESSDTAYVMRKNRVVSLNGLGNIYLSIRSYERADSAFRLALAGEHALGSNTGQAINYANLGAIYNARGDDDKAMQYYRKSMELNRADNNDLGIALCHTYFGNVYEKHRQYEKALREYSEAYRIMEASEDKWHSLEPLLALASIYIDRDNDSRAATLLARAMATADSIKSIEHLASIHDLYYRMYSREGRYREALKHHVLSTTLQDSVVDMEKSNRIHNIGITIERGRQQQRVDLAQQELRDERSAKYIGYGILIVIVMLLMLAVGLMYYSARVRAHSHRVLREASRMRESFFTNITHEFRTPLTVILGLSKGIADDDECKPEIRHKAQTIQRNGDRLLTLITQLLDISRIKSEIGDPDWRHGNIVAQVSMLVECNREYAAGRNIAIKMDTPVQGIEMDFVPDYVNKLFSNLMSNALKFTPDGGTITIRMKKVDTMLDITFADTGSGISEDKLPHIFKPFYSDDSSYGTGIGLALVHQIIDAVDGTIEVSSKQGQGTVFHITVPIHNTAKPLSKDDTSVPVPHSKAIGGITNPTDETSDSERKHVLVIEDNNDVAEYICSQLSDTYTIHRASNGRQGLAMAREIVPDIIITDVMMPGIDGLEVCRQIRKDNLVNHIPIIMVTARITEADKIRGLEAGADAYLAKTFNADELCTRVDKLLEQRALLRDKFATQILRITTPGSSKAMTENTNSDQFLKQATESIRSMLIDGNDVSVASLASHLGINTRQLHRKITSILGQTPVSFIRYAKIQYACELLDKAPETPLKNVAIDCGFADYSHFARVFKEVTGTIPTDYVGKKA